MGNNAFCFFGCSGFFSLCLNQRRGLCMHPTCIICAPTAGLTHLSTAAVVTRLCTTASRYDDPAGPSERRRSITMNNGSQQMSMQNLPQNASSQQQMMMQPPPLPQQQQMMMMQQQQYQQQQYSSSNTNISNNHSTSSNRCKHSRCSNLVMCSKKTAALQLRIQAPPPHLSKHSVKYG